MRLVVEVRRVVRIVAQPTKPPTEQLGNGRHASRARRGAVGWEGEPAGRRAPWGTQRCRLGEGAAAVDEIGRACRVADLCPRVLVSCLGYIRRPISLTVQADDRRGKKLPTVRARPLHMHTQPRRRIVRAGPALFPLLDSLPSSPVVIYSRRLDGRRRPRHCRRPGPATTTSADRRP